MGLYRRATSKVWWKQEWTASCQVVFCQGSNSTANSRNLPDLAGLAGWQLTDGSLMKYNWFDIVIWCYLIWPLIWYDLFNWFDYDITSISVSLSIVEQRRKLHCVYRLWCHMTWTANFLRLSRSSQCPTQLNSSLRECPKVIHAWAPLEAARATKVMPVVVAALAKLQNWWISLHCGPSDPSEMELLSVNLKCPSVPYIHNS